MASPPFSVHLQYSSGDMPLPTATLLVRSPSANSRFLHVLTAALAVLLLFPPFSSASAHATVSVARPLCKLTKPVVLLISTDGFRFGFQYKAPNPHLRRLIANGTSAVEGLIPVFPTYTFPNHYSIVTGLYPSSHGIINNLFPDPISGDTFTTANRDPKWWLGEPLWVTAANQGLQASTFFWPGSEVKKGSWDCPGKYCRQYNGSVPFEERVDAILGYFDLPADEMPQLVTLYMEDPDAHGHQVGPDDPAITEAVMHIDEMMGRLIAGLEARGVFEDVNIIWVGDHGIVGTCDQKLVSLEDLAPWIEVKQDWVLSTTPLLAIRPTNGVSPAEVVARMNQGLGSGKVKNGKYLKVYLKEDLPSRLHYSESYRIPPIIGLVDEGYKVEIKRSEARECGGAHGYDNAFFSMRTVFVAHGPRFQRGKTVPSFENVEIYNVVASILGLRPASNNGSASFHGTVLLPTD
ncbi:ectonucleotide pyrophosphatase/phosphodiesterase family member 1-like [Lolium rigidum]|uniref:ectonucleotide pyrophosphatase/phosphodiesterase family member 1-like n=1 Tax=Lolium rigidum TaxID=89674 RepID=UPI001F5C199B|nr:ectonucleotide pyrophosphatase/phosphodiesterase family member 1-like [Lolium rigidum]